MLEVAPAVRARVNALYMTIIYTCGAFGSIGGVLLYTAAGWGGVGALEAGLALLTLIAVLTGDASPPGRGADMIQHHGRTSPWPR